MSILPSSQSKTRNSIYYHHCFMKEKHFNTTNEKKFTISEKIKMLLKEQQLHNLGERPAMGKGHMPRRS